MEEAQNMSPEKKHLTRIGEHSKFIISGDLDQSDKYRDYTKSGLYDAMTRHKNITDIGFVVCL
jgi:phosphate starvation-inducible protein PhoH